MFRKFSKFIAILLCLAILAGCSPITAEDIAGYTFVYAGEGAGGDFEITLNSDGTFSYYEGLLSSYIGSGEWVLDGDILTLYEYPNLGYGFVNRFRVMWGKLYFLTEGSDNFLYVKVQSGEQFKAK